MQIHKKAGWKQLKRNSAIRYVQHSRQEMEVLFTFLADRYGRGSLRITSNLPFSKCEQIFKDPMTAAAAIDRLVDHSVILELNIESYLMEMAKKNKSKNLITRQRALNEWILSNGNLWAGQRSLIVGHSDTPFFRRIKERINNMQQTVYNPQKGRLETIDIDFTDENTTWFDECEDNHGIFSITDLQGGILIKEADYTYPLYVYDISRADIGHDHGKERELHDNT